MSKLYFKVSSDWEEVVKLRNEIVKLKQELKSMDSTQSPATFKTLNTQLAASTQQLDGLVAKAAQAGAVMEGDFKKKIFDASQSVNGFTEKIIAQKNAVGSLQTTIRKNKELYKNIVSRGGEDKALLNHIREQERALGKERDALFNLTQQQAEARLSVKKLRDEYALYKDDAKDVTEANNGVAVSWKKALAVIGGAGVLKALGSEMIRVRGEFQSADTAIQTLLGSKEKADALMMQVREYAKISPLEFSDVTAATQMMLGFNIEAEKVPRFISAIGDVSMGEAQKFNSLTLAFSQMSATGKLMGQDMNQMINAGFNPLQAISDKTGKSIEVLKNEMSKGAISAEMVQQAFIDATSAGGKFFQMSENASKTINGQLSMMHDAMDAAFNEMGQKSEGVIMSGIQMTTSLIENYETVGKVLAGLIITYGTYRTAVMLVTAAESKHTLVEIGLTNVRVLARKAQLALNASMLTNPYVALAVAVGGLITANLTLLDTTRQLKAVEDEYNEVKDKAIAKEQKLRVETDKYLSVAENHKAAIEDRKDAIVQLIQKYPAIFEKYKTEAEMLQHILDIHKEIDKYEKKKSVANPQNKLNGVNMQIADLEKLAKQRYHGGRGLTNAENAKLAMLKNKRSELEGTLKKEETDAILADLTGYSNSQIEAAIKDRERILAKMQLKGASKGTITGKSILSGTFTKEELEGQKKLLEAALVKPATYKEDLAKAKEKWEEAKKGYEALLKDQQATSEQVKKAREDMQLKEKAYKDLGGITGNALTKEESQAEKLRKEQEKYALLQSKQSQDNKRQSKDLEFEATQSRIDAMQQGSERTIAQMKLNHQKEVESLKRNREDYLRKKIEAERSLFEANPSNKGKSFDTSTISLSKDEEDMFKNIIESTISKQGNEISSYYKDLLAKYQSYTEKRLATQKKFQEERDSLVKAGASKETLTEHDYQRDEALESIDNEFAMREDSFKAWADNIADLSLEKLRELLVQAERELEQSEFLNPNDPKLAGQRAKVTSLKNTIGEKSEKTSTSPNKRSQKEWQDLYKTLSKVEKEFGEIGNTVGGTAGEIISAAGGIATSTLQMIDGIVTLANGSSEAMSGTAQAASASIQAVEKASVILAIIGAALQIATKLASLFGNSSMEYYESLKDELGAINEIYGDIIEKSKEKIVFGGGFAALESYREANDLLERQIENYRKLAEAGGDARKTGSHSYAYRANERLSGRSASGKSGVEAGKGRFEDISEVLGKNITKVQDLYNLTGEELYLVQTKFPEAWSKIPEEITDSLQAIIDCREESEKLRDSLNEAITGVSFDSFYNEFIDMLSDMDTSAEDMAENFGEYLRKSILAAMVAKNFQEDINKLYDKWVAAGEEDSLGGMTITEDEARDIQDGYKKLVDAMVQARDNMGQAFGWDSSATSQDSSSRGFQTMSQDTGEELNGRFTALQVAGEEIKNQNVIQSQSLNLLTARADAILSMNTETRNIADDTRDLIAQSYLELVQISENTGNSAKYLKDIKADIAEVKKNTSKL
ncbi:tape measure protein [Bacteroides sp.]|uniref:tape measure protein n=1 Tax=Bacteroides sp. TaxID=29523 RepID=UPI003AB1EC23